MAVLAAEEGLCEAILMGKEVAEAVLMEVRWRKTYHCASFGSCQLTECDHSDLTG